MKDRTEKVLRILGSAAILGAGVWVAQGLLKTTTENAAANGNGVVASANVADGKLCLAEKNTSEEILFVSCGGFF